MKPETMEKIIDHQKIAYIASVDNDGCPNIKAMLAPRKRNGLKEFWFTTNTSSMRAEQYRGNPKASIYFCDQRFFRGVMLVGVMEVLADAESKEMIWQDGDTVYYPGGVTDPDYCVLKFTAESVRWYGNFKSESFPLGAEPRGQSLVGRASWAEPRGQSLAGRASRAEPNNPLIIFYSKKLKN